MASTFGTVLDRTVHLFVKEDVPPGERERRWYLALCLTVAFGIASGYLVVNASAGRSAETVLDITLLVVLTGALALNRNAADARWGPRLASVGLVSVLGWSVYEGLGAGFAYLWLYVIPAPAFFLFGRAEGAIWTGLAFLIAVTFLATDVGAAYPAPATARFVITYLLISGLSLGLERSHSRLRHELAEEKAELERVLGEVRTLSAMIPMCAWCRKVKNDDGYWSRIEEYLDRQTGTQVSHGLCDSCAARLAAGERPD